MDSKVKFYAIFGIAVAGGGTLTATVYSRNEAVIYFWNCTAAVRVCNLTNAIIFFALSTIAVMALLYLPDFIRQFKRNQINESSSKPNVETSSNVPDKYYAPTKKLLMRKIGVDIQKIGEQFQDARYKFPEDKLNKCRKVQKAFEAFRVELGHQANIDLHDTQIPVTIKQLKNEITKYISSLILHSYNERERTRERIGSVPPEILNLASDSANAVKEIERKVDSLIRELVDLCKGD